jgi:hypothetical protein
LPDRRFEKDPGPALNSTQDRRFINPFQSKEMIFAGAKRMNANIGDMF